MTQISSLTATDITFADTTDSFLSLFDAGGVVLFLFAGTILFASLVVGSSISLLSAGAFTMTSAILNGFLSIGLWSFGVFLAALVVALIAAAIQRSQAG
jgi:hypothetical protein